MKSFYALRSKVLEDRTISPEDVASIRAQIEQDGALTLDDMKLLVELLSDADSVCREFDDLFFPALRAIVLQDGRVTADEQFFLLKMLYSDGRIREQEKRFLVELRRDAVESSPEFDSLCETAFAAPSTGWDVGGRA
ncbi:MAG: hypothetical protein AB7O38_08100 [Pirellulaceae bacterium]